MTPHVNDIYSGASLVALTTFLKQKVMYIWYALMLRQRILFSGTTTGSHVVGLCCISAPLLVLPLHGFSDVVFPYVPITDFSPLHLPQYIAGVTNPLFEDSST